MRFKNENKFSSLKPTSLTTSMNCFMYQNGWEPTFYDQVVKVEKGWVEQEVELLISAALSSEARLPNE